MADTTTNNEAVQQPPVWKRMLKAEFWQKQNNWLGLLIFVLLAVLITYLTIHDLESYTPEKASRYYGEPHEAEFKRLDPEDISQITSLINDGSTNIPVPGETIGSDSGGAVYANTTAVRFKNNPNNRVVKEFILEQVPYVYPEDTVKIFNLLDLQPNSLAVSFIQNAKFRVKSYFWLAGPHTYIEVIFWTIFGVLTSIIFYIAMAIANGTGFKPSETPGHLAKIVYAPFISLIIIFSYNYISNPDSVVDISASKGTLIISFLLGFYSSRAMKMLDKIKDVVLPYGEDSKSVVPPTAETDPGLTGANAAQGSAVTVDVDINDPSHQDAEELNGHISQTVVTLTPQGGGDPITLEKTGDDELDGNFSAPNVPEGSYNLTASLATTDGGNYEGSQGINVVNGENNFNLTLTKTAVSG